MRQLLNTLYILSEDSYLTLDGETVVINRAQAELARIPLHTLEGIVCFSYAGASPALMGKCARLGVDLSFFSPRGQFLARTVGEERGNVLLRRWMCPNTESPTASTPAANMPAALFWARCIMPAGCWSVPPGITPSAYRSSS